MSTDTASPFDGDSADGEESDGLHAGALASAVRDTASVWGFGLLMIGFTAVALVSDVYTLPLYTAFFAVLAVGTLAAAGARAYGRYGHHRFEATHDY